jgi:hypothetical protein
MLARNDNLRAALKCAASAMKAHGPDFALAGSYALWVFGGPEPTHDVDFAIAESDAETAAETLHIAGFEVLRTPEDWLFKALIDGDFVIDVLHRLNGVPVDRLLVESAELCDVLGIRMRVLAPTVVVTEKLRALTEHYCNYADLLPGVRAVRERVDWDAVRIDTADNDFAVAFLVLTDRLGITR